jgi:hypothetical protein
MVNGHISRISNGKFTFADGHHHIREPKDN